MNNQQVRVAIRKIENEFKRKEKKKKNRFALKFISCFIFYVCLMINIEL
jgi:hypothetical protein